MRFIYNILFAFFFLLSAPYYFWKMRRRGNWRAGFGERFGKYDTKLKTAITNTHANNTIRLGFIAQSCINPIAPTSKSSGPLFRIAGNGSDLGAWAGFS